MTGKQHTTKSTEPRTGSKSPPCPKCGKPMKHRALTKGGKMRYECRSREAYCYSTTDPTAPYRDQRGRKRRGDTNPQFRRALGGVKKLVITCAQNATPVHGGFFDALKHYCKYNNAELIVIPIRYKNPTSRWTLSQANAEKWEEELKPYLYNQRKQLNENLDLLADIKTVPTAIKPLSGFESITGASSGILGHTKLQMTCIPTPQGRYPKVLTTTGACTVKNYTDSKAGKKGEFHHSLSAVVVEIYGKKFFMRHLCATKDGEFIDLTKRYTSKGVRKAGRPLAMIFGDTHRATMDKQVEAVTFGKGGMVDTLNPKTLVFHDLHDGYAVNHHEKKDPFAQVKRWVNDMHREEAEVKDDVTWLRKVGDKREVIIVPSNHDDFLTKWLKETDWRNDPANSEFYLKTALELVQAIHRGEEAPQPFAYWVDILKGNSSITCLKRDESFVRGGVELSMHGDKGPNGSKGSRESLRRIGVRSFIGHSHTPGIEEGCWQVGTSTELRAGYNIGPSNWLHCHGVVHENGKRQLFMIIDGHWCHDVSVGH